MQDPTPHELLEAAVEISAGAATIPMRYFRASVAVEDKADESPVTIADRETERHITRALLERFPAHGIFGEEYGRKNAAARILGSSTRSTARRASLPAHRFSACCSGSLATMSPKPASSACRRWASVLPAAAAVSRP
jgi:3'-phosphoadenosine 5'-phosphosulfate (PAPS) 3'-phosphatase